MEHNDKEANTYYLNPPKGTTDNHRWAVNASDYLLELGFPAIPCRPAGNLLSQSENTPISINTVELKPIVDEIMNMTYDEVKEELLRLRVRQKMLSQSTNSQERL